MILCDYHMHSNFSTDSSASMTSMIEQAIKLGFKEICFTDHYDPDFPRIPEASYSASASSKPPFTFDLPKYLDTLDTMKARYGSQIKIRTGIELGLKSGIEETVKQLLAPYKDSFDFIIGSSHLLNNLDPYYPSFWKSLMIQSNIGDSSNPNLDTLSEEEQTQLVRQAIHDYFVSILNNIRDFNDFQVYGHLDYIVRYAPQRDRFYHVEDHRDLIDQILIALIQAGKGIEINTSGLKSGMSYPNPHISILKRYRELGGEIITFGSDAHSSEYVGYERKKAFELLKASNFNSYTTFEHKNPIFHKL